MTNPPSTGAPQRERATEVPRTVQTTTERMERPFLWGPVQGQWVFHFGAGGVPFWNRCSILEQWVLHFGTPPHLIRGQEGVKYSAEENALYFRRGGGGRWDGRGMTAPQQNRPVLQMRAAIPRRYPRRNHGSKPLRAWAKYRRPPLPERGAEKEKPRVHEAARLVRPGPWDPWPRAGRHPLKNGPGKSGLFIKARRRVPAPKGRRSVEKPRHPLGALSREPPRLAARCPVHDDRGEGREGLFDPEGACYVARVAVVNAQESLERGRHE